MHYRHRRILVVRQPVHPQGVDSAGSDRDGRDHHAGAGISQRLPESRTVHGAVHRAAAVSGSARDRQIRIAEIAETTIVLETMAGKIKMERSAISLEMTAKLNEKK